MRHRPHRQRAGALQREILFGWNAIHRLRYRGGVSVPLGGGVSRFQDGGFCRNVDLHRAGAGWLFLCLEERRARLVRRGYDAREAARPEEPMTLPEGLEPFALTSSE